MDIIEILKYLFGSLPGIVALAWKWRKDTKKETIKDYKEFLVELEAAHDKLLEAKEEILKLTFENNQLKDVNTKLNATIKELAAQIKEIKEKISKQNPSTK